MEVSGIGSQKMAKKQVILRGGVSDVKWGNQYHQQDRVYDRHGVAQAINAAGNNGNIIRKVKKCKNGVFR